MPTLFITEFRGQAVNSRGGLAPMAQLPPQAEKTVAVAGASAASGTLDPATEMIRLHADVACCVAVGVTPVATTASMRMSAGSVEYFRVPAGAGYKIAAIASA